jgi:spore coat protein U-like protein
MKSNGPAALAAATALALLFWTTPGEAQLGLNCSISTGGVAFGTYDVFSPAPVDAAGSVIYQCTLGTLIVVQLGSGSGGAFSPRTMLRSGEPLNYNLYLDAARTQVWGNGTSGTGTHNSLATVSFPTVVPIHARIFPGQNVTVGSYTDSVVATIVF